MKQARTGQEGMVVVVDMCWEVWEDWHRPPRHFAPCSLPVPSTAVLLPVELGVVGVEVCSFLPQEDKGQGPTYLTL